MEKVTIDIQRELNDICEDKATTVEIKGTHKLFSKKCRSVKVRYLRNATIERISTVSLDKRDDTLHELQFVSKQAALIVLNGFFKIKFFYPILWRWFFYIRQYKAEQLYPIIAEGKKKIPQIGFFLVTTLTASMRDTTKAMTRAEVERIQSELSSESKE